MKTKIIYGIAFVVVIMAAVEVSAQRYPERRMAREGNKAYDKGDFEAAETEYRRALETNPELDEARFNLGNAFFKQEKGEQAVKIYMGIAADSTALPSMTCAANFNAGNTMLAGQKIEEAIEFYKQALRIDPTDMQAKYNLAYAQKLLQNPPPDDQDQDQDQKDDQDQDQEQDQDQDQDQEQDQDQDQDQDQKDDQGEDQQDQGDPPQSDRNEQSEGTIKRQDAEQMLDAIQDAEDKTREKMDAKKVQTGSRSGKNW